MSWLKNAFAVPRSHPQGYSREELLLLDKLAQKVHQHKMTLPAILFLETMKPLAFVGSQVMVFFQPLMSALFSTQDYDLLSAMLEDRQTVELLLEKIEHLQKRETDK